MNWTGIQKVKTFSHFFCGQKVWKYNIFQFMQFNVWLLTQICVDTFCLAISHLSSDKPVKIKLTFFCSNNIEL